MSDTSSTTTNESQPSGGGIMGLLVAGGIVTAIAGGLGAGFGMWTASGIETALTEREAEQAALREETAPPIDPNYVGSTRLGHLEPVITNLAVPANVWVRIEAAMVYDAAALVDPGMTGAEIRQDVLAYLRTLTLEQLEGPSALHHLREDLNERVQLRTDNQVSELIIQALVVQ